MRTGPPRFPRCGGCGHSACRQNWIDTGELECIIDLERREAWGEAYHPGEQDDDVCDGCLGFGWDMFLSDFVGFDHGESGWQLQRCDECAKYDSDDAALEAVWPVLQQLFGGEGDEWGELTVMADRVAPADTHGGKVLDALLRQMRALIAHREHECPESPHELCGECSGDPVCGCPPGECPEDLPDGELDRMSFVGGGT